VNSVDVVNLWLTLSIFAGYIFAADQGVQNNNKSWKDHCSTNTGGLFTIMILAYKKMQSSPEKQRFALKKEE